MLLIGHQKVETKRVRWTVSGDMITYKDNLETPTSDLTTVKNHLNKVISTQVARYVTMDIKDFYLSPPLNNYEHSRIPIKNIPQEIIDQ